MRYKTGGREGCGGEKDRVKKDEGTGIEPATDKGRQNGRMREKRKSEEKNRERGEKLNAISLC